MRNNPADVRFSDALKVARNYFGEPRINGSHHIFTTAGAMVVNLQEGKNGQAKPYQVRQLLEVIDAETQEE
jgi:hypothetical protein